MELVVHVEVALPSRLESDAGFFEQQVGNLGPRDKAVGGGGGISPIGAYVRGSR